jgi:hypothetical protein
VKPAGYSGTPLSKKLGIAASTTLCVLHAPEHYDGLLGPLPAGTRRVAAVSGRVTLVHAFLTSRSTMARLLQRLRPQIRPDAAVWVSWPKKASGVPTDITENTIRDVALPLGFVDVKVCAVDEVWSGLKLVIRRSER